MQREDQIVSIIKNDDGTISIEGQKGSYTQKLIRSLALRISHLTVSRSFRTDEDNGQTTVRLSGEAIIDRDRLGRMGLVIHLFVSNITCAVSP